MATACRIGGITAGLSPPGVEAFTTYGERVGMVFQIVDDILDVVATDEQLGKPAGNDLVEGVYTLPVIRALASEAAGADLRVLLGGPLDRAAVDEARRIIRSNGALSAAITVARGYADEAASALDELAVEDGAVIVGLQSLGGHLIDSASV